MNINENIVGEQPQNADFNLGAEEQQKIKTENLNSGSPNLLSKFKSVEALSEAYQNLEKEFTQKCQKIKELNDKILMQENMEKQKSIPEYQKEGWNQKVEDFYTSHPEAKQYAYDISKVIQTDSKIASSETALEDALTKVLASKFMPYTELIKNPEFLDKYVYSNEQINQKIVMDYLNNVRSNKVLPLMSSGGGTGTFASPVKRPKTLQDASVMAQALFKNQN